MSAAWDAHIATVNGLLDAEYARRQARLATATAARTQAAAAGVPATPTAGGVAPDTWQGGVNGGNIGADTQAATGSWGGGFPNASTIASALDINPVTARAGMTALGLLSGPLGVGLSALNGIGNAVNTSNNVGMLNGLGVSPGVSSVLGGLLGFNGLSGNTTSALNAAMANQYSGFSNLSGPNFSGDLSGVGGWGGWGDIAAGMDQANAEQNAANAAASGPSNPSGGMADRGDISSQDLGGYQRGGYTGAGADGVVQPDRPAGVVHEGELVIPAQMVRMMRLRGLLG